MSGMDFIAGIGAVGMMCIGLVLITLAICWAVLPFILIAKLNAQRKATEDATKQLAYELGKMHSELGKVAQSTRQTAVACAALTMWAEREHAALTKDPGAAK